jgi:hypothetical protein
MSFVFPLLLYGLIAVGAPILLHLLMRRKPKTLPFPAFRFLLKNQRTNQRRLRLRHLLLLLLRVGLIALIVLSLARTRVLSPGLTLSSDSPVSAIFVFDTSASMDYRMADGRSALEEAKRRAQELLAQFPAASRVLVLDTSAANSLRMEWQNGTHAARARIDKVALEPASGPVTQALAQALMAWQQESPAAAQGRTRPLARLLCVFSDRTPACWRADQAESLFEQSDALPPRMEGLEQARGRTAGLVEMLGQLRETLPPAAGQDYPSASLIETLESLKERSARWQPTDFPLSAEDIVLVRKARKATREMLAMLGAPAKDADAEAFRLKLATALGEMADALRGFHAWWIDVGTEAARDFGIVGLEFPRGTDNLPRTTFSGRDPILVKAQVAAQGTDFDTTLSAFLGRESVQVPVRVAAGRRTAAPLELDVARWKLKPGTHSLEVRWNNEDPLAGDNRFYATFAIEMPKRVLILADRPPSVRLWEQALHRHETEVRTPTEIQSLSLADYDAIYLIGLAAPEPALWGRIEKYLRGGGSVGIVPGGDEMRPDAYDAKLLAAPWKKAQASPVNEKGQTQPLLWKLGQDLIYEHPMLAPWKGWIDSPVIDFIRFPQTARGAYKVWRVEAPSRDARVLAAYDDADGAPALLERQIGQGRVVQFTVPLDERDPPWHNYFQRSFFFALAHSATRYLVGEAERRTYQFTVGEGEAHAWLPAAAPFTGYLVRGDDTSVSLAPPAGRILAIPQPLPPGNYVVQGILGEDKQDVARFSVNLPAEEWNLGPLTSPEPDLLLGTTSRIPANRRASLSDLLQGRLSEPLDLFPYLMLGLLVFLALENVLANKFYREQPEREES